MVAPWSELVSAVPAAIPALRHSVRRWLHAAQWPADEALDLVLAVNEAVTNVVEHAYPPGKACTVVATADEVPLAGGLRRVLIVIADRGRWRPAPADPGDRGRGIPMISAIAQSLHIERSARGTRVTITSRPVPAVVDRATGPSPVDWP